MTRPAVPDAPSPGWGVRPPALDVLQFGAHTFAVADEAVVLGRLLPGASSPVSDERLPGLVESAEALVAEGAALVEVSLAGVPAATAGRIVGALAVDLGLPVVAAVGSAEAARALAAGAVAVVPTEPPTDHLLAAIADSPGALLLSAGAWPGADRSGLAEAARRALAAGLAPDRVLVDVATGRSVPGSPVLAGDPPMADASARSATARGLRGAAFALAVAQGARLLRTTDPRSARRTSSALAAIRRAGAVRHQAPA